MLWVLSELHREAGETPARVRRRKRMYLGANGIAAYAAAIEHLFEKVLLRVCLTEHRKVGRPALALL